MNKEIVQKMCHENNWDFNLFVEYVALIEKYNKVMNLTGFKDDRLWGEGILESLVFMNQITKNAENIDILDIGAGAGFPSIPYALTKPKNKITIYEPLQKRVKFLNIVIEKLNLQNYVSVYAMRSEEQFEKNLFDIVTARAVADIRAMLMSSFHLVKLKGHMSLIKGKNFQDEITAANDIAKQLKIEFQVEDLVVPNSDKNNKIVHIKKLRSTPKEFPYPWKDIVKGKK
ncbi:16S rRNA (guanine(527)-N(7))-methyltransferase RsmG [Mycoplasma corogypsi]|uniref:16S rRNA (guanine(527)-N(7))-methyltransferase RsmG n=1 Tax=Mycoplasma corogypsi TaxID=2106 RepID=UPI003872AC83